MTIGASARPPQTTPEELITRAAELRELIRETAAAAEQLGHYTPEVHAAFREAGFYDMFTPKRCRVGYLDILEVLQPPPEIIGVQLWRSVEAVPPTLIDPRNNPMLPPMAGDPNCLARHLLQRFAFGQLFSLFPVANVVLAVAAIGALPLTRCVLVTDPDVRRISAPVSACHTGASIPFSHSFATLFATVVLNSLF